MSALTGTGSIKPSEVVWQTVEPLKLTESLYLLAACTDYWLDFELHEVEGWSHPGGEPHFAAAESTVSPCSEASPQPTEFSRIMHGFVKWDGCTQWWHEDDPWHFDSLEDVPDIKSIIATVWSLAEANMRQWKP